jgi:hypothetical protein
MDKHRERATVEAFLISRGYPLSCLHEWDRERPDALLRLGDKLVGVEVTAINEAVPRRTASPQWWTAQAHRIVSAAQTVFENRQPTALIVRFGFSPAWNPESKRTENFKLPDQLSDVVERALSGPPPYLRSGDPITLKDPHPDVSWAYIARAGQELGGNWAPNIAGSVQRASADDIQATVARKDVNVRVYRESAPEAWLLIDCDLTGQEVALDVPEANFLLTSEFDRVFCCGFGMWKWVEISTTKAAPESSSHAPISR